MHFVARGAGYTGAGMLTQANMTLLAGALMALDAGLGDLVGRERRHADDRAFGTARFEMLGDVTVALLAGIAFLPALCVGGAAPGVDLIFMAFGACLSTRHCLDLGCRCRRRFDGVGGGFRLWDAVHRWSALERTDQEDDRRCR